MIKKQDRIQWIDISKGLLIFLVIIGHLPISERFYTFIFAFHMYAFFFINGLTWRLNSQLSLLDFMRMEVKKIILPYLFYAFVWDATNLAINYMNGEILIRSVNDAVRNIVIVITCGGISNTNSYIGPVWFLIALLWARVIYFCICKSTEKMWIKGIVSFGLLGGGYCLNGITQLPFKFLQSLSCVFFLFCGEVFIKGCCGRKLNCKLLSITGIVGFAVVYLLSLFEEPTLNVISNRFPNNPIVTIIAAILGCLSICCISIGIEVVKGIAGILSYYGMISLLIMGIHSEIRVVMIKVLGMVGIQGLLQNVIVFLTTLIVAIPIYELFSRFIPRLTGCKRKIERCGGKNY